MTELASWLKELGLPSKYRARLEDEGYDMALLRVCGVLSEEDFNAIGIKKGKHRKIIRTALQAFVDKSPIVVSLQPLESLSVSNCWQLLEYCDTAAPAISLVCWNFIKSNLLVVLNDPSFLRVSEKTINTLLQRDDLQVEEEILVLAVNYWYKANRHLEVDKLALTKNTRLGTVSTSVLQKADNSEWCDRSVLYWAWRDIVLKETCRSGHHVPNAVPIEIPMKFFTSRVPVSYDHAISRESNEPAVNFVSISKKLGRRARRRARQLSSLALDLADSI